MSSWYYYDKNGFKQGPITSGQLKGLAAQGVITPETTILTETGKSATAKQVKGLMFAESAPPKSVPAPAPLTEADPLDWDSLLATESHAPSKPQALLPRKRYQSQQKRRHGGGDINTYLVWSVFTTCCCMPLLGIPALIFSILCGGDLQAGRYDAAATKSSVAFWLNVVALIPVITGVLIALLMPVMQSEREAAQVVNEQNVQNNPNPFPDANFPGDVVIPMFPTQQPEMNPPPDVFIAGPMSGRTLGHARVGTPFSEKTPDDAVLVGFVVTLKKWGTNAHGSIESVQPLYRAKNGTATKRGAVYGNTTGESRQVLAPAGYAVGAVNGRAMAAVDGFELICMKIKPDGSLDPSDTRTLAFVGNPQGSIPHSIDGRGKRVTEIKGYTADFLSSLELVFE